MSEYAEFVRLLVNRQMQTDEDHKQLREHFQCLFRQVRELDNPDADEAAALILPRRRPTELTDIAKMQEVAEALETVLSDFSTDYGQPNMTVGSEENVRLSTDKEKKTKIRMAEKAMEERLVAREMRSDWRGKDRTLRDCDRSKLAEGWPIW